MKNIRIIFLFVCLSIAANSYGQLAIQFSPVIYGQSLEGLSFATLMNSSVETVRARVTIKIRESQAGNVVTVVIPSVLIRPGSSPMDRTAYSNSRFSFGNNNYGLILSQSGKFPEGEYEYCFEIEMEPKAGWVSNYFENCFSYQLQPMTPLLLVHPVDGDVDCNTRPNFIWQPPIPLPPEARFRLVLSELRPKQDLSEAINYNQPLINQGNLFGNQLSYPFNAPSLKEGTTYAWQVIVYNSKLIIKRSEIWTYTVKCEEVKKQPGDNSYRELKEIEDGNFYIADRILRFSFNNPYSKGLLDYSISDLANPAITVKGLPRLEMQAGLNKYELDLTEINAFKTGKEYLLKIRLANGRVMPLRFIYTNEEQ